MNCKQIQKLVIMATYLMSLVCLTSNTHAGILSVSATVPIITITNSPSSVTRYIIVSGCTANPSTSITYTGSAITTSGEVMSMIWGVISIVPPASTVSTNFTTEPAYLSTNTNTNASNNSYTFISTFPQTIQPGPNPIIINCEVNHDYVTNIGTNTMTNSCNTNTNSTPEWTATLLQPQVTSVSFAGPSYWPLESDDASVQYSAPQWTDINGNGNASDAGEHNYAVAFTQNTVPSVGATFNISGAAKAGLNSIQVRAIGSDGINIPATTVTGNGDVFTLPPTPSSASLQQMVKYYNGNFALDWQICVGNGIWSDVETTYHTLYVTFAPPQTSDHQESIVYIGCNAANGDNSQTSAANAIWTQFSGLNVQNVKGSPLTFYKSWTTLNADAPSLLSEGDGQCGAWVDLLKQVRLAQGINQGDSVTTFVPINSAEGFLVNNWSFSGSGVSGNSTYPFLNILPTFTSCIGPHGFIFIYADVNDLTGIPGQGIQNPLSIFQLHKVLAINGTYFDPSFGKTYTSAANFQQQLAAFSIVNKSYSVSESAVNMDLNGNGEITDTVSEPVMLIRKNQNNGDITTQ